MSIDSRYAERRDEEGLKYNLNNKLDFAASIE
jgi:hypothetical protein